VTGSLPEVILPPTGNLQLSATGPAVQDAYCVGQYPAP
jgi:hypothetical protein